jgi:peptidoglycan hydrolase CwlO-like protein
MKNLFNKIVGVLLILASIIGLVFSIGGIVALQKIKPDLTTSITNGVKLISVTLVATAQGLEITQKSLKSSVDSISALQSTIQATAKTLGSTQPLLDNISKLMEEELPKTIRATGQSLKTAQESSAVIDSVLMMLSNVPIFGIPYNPEISLSTALGEVAQTLDGLPEKFIAMQKDLENTGDNLQVVEADMETVVSTIGGIQSSVSQYESVLKGYQDSLAQVQKQLDALVKNLPTYINILVIALTVFLVWMAIAQLGLLTQGWELLHRDGKDETRLEDKTEAKPEVKAED